METWETKAHRLVADMAHASYKQSNPVAGRKHRAYTLPPIATALVDALGMRDRRTAEETCKALFHVAEVIPRLVDT